MADQYTNILIVRTDRIGDVILTTPSIRALRQAFPHARISVLVAPETRSLIAENSYVDEILVDDRVNEHKGFMGYLKIIQSIRRMRFDIAVIYHTKKRTNLMCFLAGIPVRLGYKNNKFGFLLNRPVGDVRHAGEQHEAQYCLDVLKALNIQSNDLRLDFPVSNQSIQWAKQFKANHNIKDGERLIVIHADASDPAKRWSEKRFAELADILVERYSSRIVFVGSVKAADISRRIIALLKRDVLDYTGRTTIDQLAGLIKSADLLVSNDSGPVHVAAAVGTPVVSIFTRNQPGINPERWGPLGKRSRTVSVRPSQSSGISFKKAQIMDTQHMELIATNEVLEAVDSLFKLC